MNCKRRMIWIVVITVLLMPLFGCQSDAVNQKKMTVAVSISPLKTITEAIAGEHVNIVTMIPPGNSPENYEPTPGVLRNLEDSVLYFSLGVPAEEAGIKPKVPQLNTELIVVDLHEHAYEVYPALTMEGEPDPHSWLSIKRVKIMVDVIALKLGEADPDHAKIYADNAKKYQTFLDETNQSIQEIVSRLNNKQFLIYHPALGYFADEYQLTMIAVEEHGKEASIKQLGEIVDYAKEKGIKTVFYQAEHDKKQAEIVASELGGKTSMIDPLSENFPQNLLDIANALLESEGI